MSKAKYSYSINYLGDEYILAWESISRSSNVSSRRFSLLLSSCKLNLPFGNQILSLSKTLQTLVSLNTHLLNHHFLFFLLFLLSIFLNFITLSNTINFFLEVRFLAILQFIIYFQRFFIIFQSKFCYWKSKFLVILPFLNWESNLALNLTSKICV